MELEVDMEAGEARFERENDIGKIIDFIWKKKPTLDTFITRPLHELARNVVYKGMLKDARMKMIRERLISDCTFRKNLHGEIVYVFGNTYARHLGRIILPPGSPWP